MLEIFVCNYFCLEIVFACIFCPGYSPWIEPLAIIAIFPYNYFVCTSGWGKSQPPLFTLEKLDMFDPIYCFQQVFWLNTRPSTKRCKQFLYFLVASRLRRLYILLSSFFLLSFFNTIYKIYVILVSGGSYWFPWA